MKTKIFIIILLTLFFNEFSYSQWQQIHPLTSSTILNSIYFVGDVGYAVGTNGEIFKTVNKGIDWYQQSSGITENLNGVFLTNSDHVITVGNNGMILRTSNGGNEWMMPDSKTTSNINSICLIDKLSYAVGDTGLILKSTDDGVSWIKQTSGTTDNLNSVYFTSSDTGYIVGNNGTLLFTNNGGQEWNSKNTGTGADYTCIQFINKNKGIAVGGNYASYERIDLTISNNSLNTSVSSTPARFKTIQYTSPQTCYAVTSSGNLYYTFNNWQTTISINYSGKLTSQYFFNDSIGFLVGKANYINATRNGVAAYSVNLHQFNDCISGDLNDVLYVNENTAYIVGNNGLLLKTLDKGNKWEKQNTTFTDNLDRIYFLNEDTGFVTSSTGIILKTKNGGTTWNIINSGVLENISSIYFKDSNNGFLLSESGYLQKTVDGGDSWNSYKKLQGGGQIINERTFFIKYDSTISSKNYSYILRTTDSGDNWDTLIQGQIWYGNKFIPYFVDSVNGIAKNFSSSSGWIASTSNGGKNWNNYFSDCSCGGHIIDIFFIDKNNIYAVSYGGCFFNSVNGGINWTKTTLPGDIGGCGTYSYSNCVAFYNEDNGLVGGDNGVLFRYGNSSISFTPTNINLSNVSIAENNASNAIIGILNTDAKNSLGKFAYTLDSTTDNIANGSFLIIGDTLKAISSFDFETKSTYNIRIKTTTTEGNSMEKNFIMTSTEKGLQFLH